MDKKIDKLLKQGDIEKLEQGSDKYFVPPIVKTVRKDGSVKLALESRELNKQVHKKEYQMPNTEEIKDTVGQTISCGANRAYIFFNDGPNVHIWSITFKHGNKRTMHFFSYRRSINGYVLVQNRILWPNHDAGRTSARNGLHPVRIFASAGVHR